MKKISFISLWALLLFSSCADFEDIINYTLPEPEIKLCLSGYVSTDSSYIFLTLNNYYLIDSDSWDNRATIIKSDDATVTLFEDGVFFDTLQPQTRQVWASGNHRTEHYYVSYKPTTPGKTYTVYAQHTDFDEVSAETVLPMPVPIQSYTASRIDYEPVTFFNLTLNIYDTPATENFYVLPYSVERNTYYTPTLMPNPIFENSTAFHHQNIFHGYSFFSDKFIDGTHFSIQYTLLINGAERIPPSTQYTFPLYSTSKDFYIYNMSRLLYEDSRYDANSNPVTIYSNVVGGYGIFFGLSKSTIETSFNDM